MSVLVKRRKKLDSCPWWWDREYVNVGEFIREPNIIVVWTERFGDIFHIKKLCRGFVIKF